VTLSARWVTLRARWVRQRAPWVTLMARWVALRARWVTFSGAPLRNANGQVITDLKANLRDINSDEPVLNQQAQRHLANQVRAGFRNRIHVKSLTHVPQEYYRLNSSIYRSGVDFKSPYSNSTRPFKPLHPTNRCI
jgi:hypothetical protein